MVQTGLVANSKIPGHLFHCGYTANVYRVVEAVVQLYTAGKFAELADLTTNSSNTPFVRRGARCHFSSPLSLFD